ncbi:hypothetical protein MUP01_06425 [Candidatus Bathyarchaeota archaeon]|nr:hypothetical protein [Candidatus Bathyarchaeota archaeon]
MTETSFCFASTKVIDRSIGTEVLDRGLPLDFFDKEKQPSVWVAPFWLAYPEGVEDSITATELTTKLQEKNIRAEVLPETGESHLDAVSFDILTVFVLELVVLPVVLNLLSSLIYDKLRRRKPNLKVVLNIKKGNNYVKIEITGDADKVVESLKGFSAKVQEKKDVE